LMAINSLNWTELNRIESNPTQPKSSPLNWNELKWHEIDMIQIEWDDMGWEIICEETILHSSKISIRLKSDVCQSVFLPSIDDHMNLVLQSWNFDDELDLFEISMIEMRNKSYFILF
jgi:small nuclear ribonucleoprotein (snRNP)-like protein